jgi:hypothetical protein
MLLCFSSAKLRNSNPGFAPQQGKTALEVALLARHFFEARAAAKIGR